nr:MAG TPA: hypothetical protein [Caudoviricetes sp.]
MIPLVLIDNNLAGVFGFYSLVFFIAPGLSEVGDNITVLRLFWFKQKAMR